MDRLVGQVKQQAADLAATRNGMKPAAVFGFSDYAYKDAFDNWINAAVTLRSVCHASPHLTSALLITLQPLACPL